MDSMKSADSLDFMNSVDSRVEARGTENDASKDEIVDGLPHL